MFHGGGINIFKWYREIKGMRMRNWSIHWSLNIFEIGDDFGMVGVDSFRKSRKIHGW